MRTTTHGSLSTDGSVLVCTDDTDDTVLVLGSPSVDSDCGTRGIGDTGIGFVEQGSTPLQYHRCVDVVKHTLADGRGRAGGEKARTLVTRAIGIETPNRHS